MFESLRIFRASSSFVILIFICRPILATDCEKCRELTEKFIQLASGSPAKGFVGGNTLWEERNFGSYATSEIRFHEILEGICTAADSACNNILEVLEHPLENWWAEVFKHNQSKLGQLTEDLCISELQLCCPNNQFGPNCRNCSPCSPIGGSCVGNGTRTGSGLCACSPGYKGAACDECDLETHFQESNICRPCHSSCSGGCTGANSTDCKRCAPGWVQVSHLGTPNCEDIDECRNQPCQRNEYCVNSAGSYTCAECSSACLGCTGPNADQCIQCNLGYHLVDGTCVDVDECSSTHSPCKSKEVCKNLIGSFTCVCEPGYVKRDGVCLPKKQVTSARDHSVRNREKIIWTYNFAKEFLKYAACLVAFLVTYRLFKTNVFITAFSMAVLGVFLYFQSSRFDFVFSKQY